MLNSRFRFHSRGGVRYVYSKGKTIRTPKMSLVHMKNDKGYTRFAVVVSKKVDKLAVGRNRIRRRVYEAIRLEYPSIIKSPQDSIFVVYDKSLATLDFAELRSLVRSLLEQSLAN